MFHKSPTHEVDPSIEIFRLYHQTKYCESYASFVNLNNEDLEKVTDCTTIDFNKLDLEVIEFEFGIEFYYLQGLSFANNLIKEFPNNFLKNLPSLRKFSAKNNFLEVLDENFLKYNKKLKIVNFSGNFLRSLSPDMFVGLKRLDKVGFYENLCINDGFPESSMEDLIEKIEDKCNEKRNMIEFVKKLVMESGSSDDAKNFINLLQEISDKNLENLTNSFSMLMKSTPQPSNSSNLLSNQPDKLTKIFQNIFQSPENQQNLSKVLLNDPAIVKILNSSITSTYDSSNPTLEIPHNFDMDELIEVLFWMIIPIALLLFIILVLISYAIYNKYIAYSPSSRSRGEVNSLCFRGLDVYS